MKEKSVPKQGKKRKIKKGLLFLSKQVMRSDHVQIIQGIAGARKGGEVAGGPAKNA